MARKVTGIGARFTQRAAIQVKDLDSLRGYWKRYRDDIVVGAYVMTGRLTRSQLRRLPKALRRMLLHGKAAADYQGGRKDLDELERLFRLEDPRS